MNRLERFLWSNLRDITPPGSKAFYDLQRVGVTGRPQYPDTDIDKLQLAHRRSEIVYAAIKAKATAAVDPRLLVQRKSKEWAEDDGHPLRRLLMRPNAEMDESMFLAAALTSRDIAGVFYAEIVRATGSKLPVALHPLDPAKVFPVPGERNTTAEYEFRDGSNRVRIKATDMLVWRAYDPMYRYQGLSPLAVCLGSVDADSAQTDFVRSFFNNAGVPSGLLTIKGRTVNNTEAEQIKARWRQRFGRDGGAQHDIAVMDENAEYQKIGAGLDELQSEILREFTETRVCMVFGTPPLIIYAFAGLKRATYSNLKEAWAGFWDATLTPLLKEWRTYLTWRLLTEFEDENLIYGEKVRLNWDMSQVAWLQDDVTEMQTRARENFRAGGITLNEYRASIGQAPDPAGDYYLRLLAYAPYIAGEQPETTAETVLAGKVTPDAAPPEANPPKAMRTKADTQRIRMQRERKIEAIAKQYLRTQYAAAAQAVSA